MKQRMGLLLALKYLTIENVCFKHPYSLLPDELKPVISCDILNFPPVVYSYLLQFLCCYHLQDKRGKRSGLQALLLSIQERYLIFPRGDVWNTIKKSLKVLISLIEHDKVFKTRQSMVLSR